MILSHVLQCGCLVPSWLKYLSPCSCLWWSDLCYLLYMFKCRFLLHIRVMLACLNDSCDVFLCLGAFLPSLMHELVCASVYCWKFWLGLHYIQSGFLYCHIIFTESCWQSFVGYCCLVLFCWPVLLQMSRRSSRGKDIVADEPATPVANHIP